MTTPKIILVEPSHPGNIGATARAMKTMGFDRLCLVKPKKFPDSEATARAGHAIDLLEQVEVFNTLQDAIVDCVRVFGSSARIRTIDKILLNPKSAVRKLHKKYTGLETAIVFGRESSGLNNAELALCDEQIRIPTNNEYSSLNLAQAVQIICYEWQCHKSDTIKTNGQDLANNTQVQGMIKHILEVVAKTDFLDARQPKYLKYHLGKIFSRCQLIKKEVNIIRGMFSALDKLTGRK